LTNVLSVWATGRWCNSLKVSRNRCKVTISGWDGPSPLGGSAGIACLRDQSTTWWDVTPVRNPRPVPAPPVGAHQAISLSEPSRCRAGAASSCSSM
jgi:hypothetical protein